MAKGGLPGDGITLHLTGDMNGTLHDSDRSTGTCNAVDTSYRQVVADLSFTPVGGGAHGREYTYVSHGMYSGAPATSRIDDHLVCTATLPHPCEPGDWEAQQEEVLPCSQCSDHSALLTSTRLSTLGYVPPPPTPAPTAPTHPRFSTPRNKEEWVAFEDAMWGPEIYPLIQQFNTKVAPWADGVLHTAKLLTAHESSSYYFTRLWDDLETRGVSRDAIPTLADDVADILGKALGIALQTCTTTEGHAGRHYRPRVARRVERQLSSQVRLLNFGRKRLPAKAPQPTYDELLADCDAG